MDHLAENDHGSTVPNEDQVRVQVQGGSIPVKKELLLNVPYFAAMFQGSWLENQEGTVALDCGNETAILILNHISGKLSFENLVPEMTVLVDLIRLADMLGLADLITFVSKYLKQKPFHEFHKPCSDCIHSILDYLPVLTLYNLSTLQNEVLDWISHHFKDVWPTQSFADLNIALKELCLKRKMSTLKSSNVLDTIVDCNVILRRLPSVKWAQAVTDVTEELKTSSLRYLSSNLVPVLKSQRFVKLKQSGEMDLSRIDCVLLQACQEVELDQACQSLSYLQKWSDSDDEEHFRNFMDKIIGTLKGNLKRNARKAMACPNWSDLTSETREELLQSALFLPWEDDRPTRPLSVLPSKNVKSTVVKSRPSSTPAMGSRNTISSQALGTSSTRSTGTGTRNSNQTNQRSVNRTLTRSATTSNAQAKPKPPMWR